jgi:pimeloyl-ACP methyl ester carboxylesterase
MMFESGNPINRRQSLRLVATVLPLMVSSIRRPFAKSGEPATPSFRSAVGAQAPRKSIELDGIRVAYTDTGGGDQVIICLHAIGHGARDFQDLSARLREQYRVIALDFPGQGNSAPDPHPASGTRYTRLLSIFVEKLDLKSVVILGNSIGGATAVRYQNEHADRVRALILCDSGGLTPPPDQKSQAYIQSYVEFFEAGRKGAPWFSAAFDGYYRTILIAPQAQAERERIVGSAYEIAPILEQAWQSFARPEESLWKILPEVRSPVLAAWARHDTIIPLDSNAPAIARFPRHALEVFDGGHAAFLEDPDNFERQLKKFLATV